MTNQKKSPFHTTHTHSWFLYIFFLKHEMSPRRPQSYRNSPSNDTDHKILKIIIICGEIKEMIVCYDRESSGIAKLCVLKNEISPGSYPLHPHLFWRLHCKYSLTWTQTRNHHIKCEVCVVVQNWSLSS